MPKTKKNKSRFASLIGLWGLSACLQHLCPFVHFPPHFSRLSCPCLLPIHIWLCVKTARLGLRDEHSSQTLGHLFPLIKGECNNLPGQILISIPWEMPSWCFSEPKLCVCVVCVYFKICACLERLMSNDGADPSHLIHLYSPECAFSSLKWPCVCVCFGSRLYVYIHLDVWLFMCLCIKHVDASDFAAPKWLDGQTVIRCSLFLPWLGK